MNSQLAITRARYRAPDLEIYIASTGATYVGLVDTSRGRIEGRLEFNGQPGPALDLQWRDPEGLPGFAALSGGGDYVYREPERRTDGWTTSTPEEVGLSRAALEALVRAVARDEAGLIHSLQIVRDGRLVLDEYFHGYGPDDLHRLASATKSVASLLIGVAIDRGLIPGVDARLVDLLQMPGSGPGWEKETLRDVLTMSMGLDWQPGERESTHGTGPDFFRRVLDRRVVSEPGTTWDYVSANVDLLAGVIFNATGRHAETFAHDVLFEPLGLQAFNWDYGKESGYNLMDGSLELRPRDLAKIGAMVAAEGRWNGRQVVSADWIRESTRTHFPTGQPLGGYGYLWWTHELSTGAGNQRVVLANGMGSQFVVILPILDLVIVTTGGNEDNGRHMDITEVLQRTLLPSVSTAHDHVGLTDGS